MYIIRRLRRVGGKGEAGDKESEERENNGDYPRAVGGLCGHGR